MGTSVWNKYKTHRRLKQIFQLLATGQELQHNAPKAGTTDVATVAQWLDSFSVWHDQTNKALGRYSAQAAAAFIHDSGGPAVNYGGITGTANARQYYALLQLRLNNLRNIVEKPEVYF